MRHHEMIPTIRSAAAADAMPIPTFPPVLRPSPECWDLCVAVACAVAAVLGGLDVDVGLKLLVHVIDPPALVGTICTLLDQSTAIYGCQQEDL